MAEIFMGRIVVRNSPPRIGKKISKLMHEGKLQEQAIGMALGMEREHRLTDSGGYIRVKKGKRSGKSQMER